MVLTHLLVLFLAIGATAVERHSSHYTADLTSTRRNSQLDAGGITLREIYNHTLKTDVCVMAFAREYCTQEAADSAASLCAHSSNNATCIKFPQSCIKYVPTNNYCYQSWKDPRCYAPEPENCYWYVGCLEDRFHCGATGYPVAYGNKYCRRFQDKICPNLSADGKKWCLSTRQCLIESSISLLSNNASLPTCSQLEDIEFGIHPNCYTSGNPSFCQLGITDIMNIVKFFDAADLFSRQTLQQFLVVLKNCASGDSDARVEYLRRIM